MALLSGLPLNLIAIDTMVMSTKAGKTKFRIISSIVKTEALIAEFQ